MTLAQKKTVPAKRATKKAAKKRPAKSKVDRAAARHQYRREHSALQSRIDSAAARDIGELPAVANPKRRAAALASLVKFNRSYFPQRYTLPFSPDHLRLQEKLQLAMEQGGLFPVAMPRGSGKTTLVETAVIYAIFTGRHDFVPLIAADREAAEDLLESIRGELETNDLLAADFPEFCYPIQKLEGLGGRRTGGQTHNGKATHITWAKRRIDMPAIAGTLARGQTIRTYGITARLRGAKHRLPGGRVVRPTFFAGDDLQTDASAYSDEMTNRRERTLMGAVLKMAGPGVPLGGVIPCTVIRKGDLADRLLDPKLHPEFHGQRFKMLYSMPARMDLWEQYNDLRVAGLQAGLGLAEATAFYVRKRREMDAGALVAWPERHNPDEASGLQHALNIYFTDPRSFAAECQSEAADESNRADDLDFLSADQLTQKINGYERGQVPTECGRLVGFVDVQARLLYYLVLAVAPDFTAYVIEYGAFPDQRLRFFSYRTAQRTLGKLAPAAGLEGRLHAGLTALVDQKLCHAKWRRDDGAELSIERLLIDGNWQSDTIYAWIRQSPFLPLLFPSHGKGIKAGDKPLNDYDRKKGDVAGLHWRIPAAAGQPVRHVVFDANWWKTFLHARLAMATGDRGSHSLYKAGASEHRMLADHLSSETPQKTFGRGREVIEWRHHKKTSDNHLLDCYAGACVAASMQGAALATLQSGPERRVVKRRRRAKVSW